MYEYAPLFYIECTTTAVVAAVPPVEAQNPSLYHTQVSLSQQMGFQSERRQGMPETMPE